MGWLSGILLMVATIAVVVVFYPKIIALADLAKIVISDYQMGSSFNFPNSSSSYSQKVNSSYITNYTLALINKDRQAYGLPNVTLSPITSAQQHADSMLQYGYFSHWDIYGMKPYMRYTLVGGLGAVQENVAFTKSGVKACLGSICNSFGNLNLTNAIAQMEYSMVYNDSICCKNGHRYNILNPYHNQVSIGIAYNSTTVYLVEDFINNYIDWFNNTPSINSNNEVTLEGDISQGYKLSTIEMSYDSPVANMTIQQLDSTSEYGYGQPIAGIVGSPLDYYSSIATIVADNYYTKGNDFLVSFNINKLIQSNGPGEYTVEVWLNDTNTGNTTIGSTYTIFINSNGKAYSPSNV